MAGKDLHILILSPQAADVEQLTRELQRAGFPCRTAQAANEAEFLGRLRDFSPDVILADDSAFVFNGTTALKLARIECPGVPFILVCERPGDAAAVEALNQGALDCVLKPGLERLAPAIRRALREVAERKDRRVAEAAFQEMEGRYRALFDRSHDCLFVIDFEGRFLDANPAALALMGYAREEIQGLTIAALLEPEMLARAFETIREVATTGSMREVTEFQFMRKNGELVVVETTASLILLHGKPFAIQGISRDVTARKAGEAELRRMNRLYAVLSHVNQILIRARSREELLQQVCDVAVRHGQFQAVAIGWLDPLSNALAVVARAGGPEDLFRTLRVFAGQRTEEQGAGSTGLPEGVVCVFNDFQTDPRTLPWRVHAVRGRVNAAASFPIRFAGQVCGVFSLYDNEKNVFQEKEVALLAGVAESISAGLDRLDQAARKQRAEAALRESELRYRMVLQETGQIVYDFDLAGGMIRWDGAIKEVLGYTWEEMQQVDARAWESHLHPEDRAQVLRQLDQAIGRGQRYHVEYRFRRRDGAYITVEEHGSFLFDGTTTATRMLGTITDITERRQLETQFLRAQRMESIGTLAGGIAHDLNNMLSPIMMAVQLLEVSVSEPDRKQLLATISGSAERGAALVKQVLSFCRGVEGRRSELRIQSVIGELSHILGQTFPKSILVETKLPENLWAVLADPTQLHQVLLNLCVNARDAMPNGGALTLSAENVLLDGPHSGLGKDAQTLPYLLLSVADTGVGIPPETREKIFDPFFTTKELGKGTGLGLSTSLAIVKSHGGLLNVYSELGAGTVFKVYLPALTASLADTLQAEEAQLPRGAGELILLVDDEAAVRTITKQTLQVFGYSVITASDGAEAMELYARHGREVAVILMDMMMPVMDGPTTIHALSRMNPNLKVIAASGLSSEVHMSRSPSDAVKAFLPKPYTAETLLNSLHNVLHAPAL